MRTSSACRITRFCASSAANGSSISSTAGIGDEGARDGAALAHAARELMRIVLAELRQADELQRRLDPRRAPRRATRRASSARSRHSSRRSSRETGRSPGTPWRSRPASRRRRRRCVPLVARSRPARMRSRVDLPQPLGPTMQTNSPGAMVRSMPSSATTRCGPLPYSLRRLRSRSPRRAARPSASPPARVPACLAMRPAERTCSPAAFALGVRIGGLVGPELLHRSFRVMPVDETRCGEFRAREAVLGEPRPACRACSRC